MLHKVVFAIVALAGLSVAVELARSQSHHPVGSVTTYTSKVDFDGTFASFDPASEMSTSINSNRERLRREGMLRLTPASNAQRVVPLNMRRVDLQVAPLLFDADEMLYSHGLDSPEAFARTTLAGEQFASD